MPIPRDPRWILLVDTGEYSTLSRHREPDADDIAGIERALRQISRAGWVAVMSHSAYHATIPELLMVRQIFNPMVSFDEAAQLFRERWRLRQSDNAQCQ